MENPNLDLVHPRGVLRRVGEMETPAMAGVEAQPAVVLPVVVNVEVVPDHVNLLRGVSARESLHEVDQRRGRPSRQHAPQNLARRYIESRQQHLGAVPLVLVLVSDGSVVARHVSGVPPFQSLHRLFVDAHHDRPLGGWR